MNNYTVNKPASDTFEKRLRNGNRSFSWITPEKDKYQKEEDVTKLTLMGVFLAIFTAFVVFVPLAGNKRKEFKLKPFDLLMLSLSTYRLGRMVAYDRIADPIRRPVAQTVPDSTGAGETVEPKKGSGIQDSLGQMISCPICAGTWIAAALVYGMKLFPGPTQAFIAIMSSIGAAELLNALTEALSWCSEAARRLAGEKR